MKKRISIIFLSLILTLSLAVLFACSTGSGGGDDPDPVETTYAITIQPAGAASGEAVTANVTKAATGATVTLTGKLNAGRRVALAPWESR